MGGGGLQADGRLGMFWSAQLAGLGKAEKKNCGGRSGDAIGAKMSGSQREKVQESQIHIFCPKKTCKDGINSQEYGIMKKVQKKTLKRMQKMVKMAKVLPVS